VVVSGWGKGPGHIPAGSKGPQEGAVIQAALAVVQGIAAVVVIIVVLVVLVAVVVAVTVRIVVAVFAASESAFFFFSTKSSRLLSGSEVACGSKNGHFRHLL
jgi:hypothetical protein